MKKNYKYKYFFGIADFSILLFSFLVSIFILRNNTSVNFFSFYVAIPGILFLVFTISLIILLIFQFNGLYRLDIILNRSTHFTHILKAIYYSSLQIVLLSFVLDSSMILDSRLLFVFFFLVSIGLLFLIRVELLKWVFVELSQSSFKRNVIIVGNGKAGKLLATKLLYENPLGLNIIGFVDDDRNVGDFVVAGKKILGNFNDLKNLVKVHSVDELIIVTDNHSYDAFFDLVDYCKSLNVPIRMTSNLLDVVSKKIQTEKYADIAVIDISPQYNDNFTLGLKRIADIAIASVGIFILSPFLALIALFVKLSSPGPIFFKQARIGKDGKEFKIYKFRSMKALDGEDEERKKMMIEFIKNGANGASDTKVINESRVTWIGNIIRKTSLDELPQLFNVIKGDMSLVGPRPCLPYEYDNYDEWQKRRVSVIPGCTGVWQVWGRSQVNYNESVVLDLYYINNMSPWLDIQLIFQTIPVMLFSRGAK
ncbi:MAG: sugar transferase [Ignavibacteriaceae bacterium]|nr:sugar transferase [Ignavibacteriaceae bacterium]